MNELFWLFLGHQTLEAAYSFDIEGCFGDCFDMAGEGEIWVYQNAKSPVVLEPKSQVIY